jgi:flagellar hook-length control protein FliK
MVAPPPSPTSSSATTGPAIVEAPASRPAIETHPSPTDTGSPPVDATARGAAPGAAGLALGPSIETVSRRPAELTAAPAAPAAAGTVTTRAPRASAGGSVRANADSTVEPSIVAHQGAGHRLAGGSQADPEPGAGDQRQTPRHETGDGLMSILPTNTFTPTASVCPADAAADVQAPPSVAPAPVGEQIVQAARLVVTGGLSQMDVRLDPPELGAIRVTATAGPDGIGLTITADRAETHALLVHALPEIQTLLAERGVPGAAVAVATTSDAPPERRAPNRRDPDRGGRASHTPTDSRRPFTTRRPVGTVDLTV